MVLTADRFEGYLDRIVSGWVCGWAWDSALPEDAVEIDVYVDGVRHTTASAELYRPDLETAGKGNGRHAFEVDLSERLRDEQEHQVSVRYARTAFDLRGSPQRVTAGPGIDAAGSEVGGRGQPLGTTFRSRFGGLWTDLSNAANLIDGKAALGWITREEADALRRWLEDGYVILPQAVPHDLIDRLEADVEEIWEGKSATRCFVEFYEGRHLVHYPAGPRFKTQPCKLLHLYAHLDSVRRVVFAEPILRLLTLVFERPVLAFQSLYFRWGSRQDIHQDTAFVKVSSPLELAASWVALEDIQPNSGELEYFVGSHKLDDYLFEGCYKWMPPKSSEYERYIASLRQRSEEMGCRRERFLAKKGDVLLWSAELGHGGSQNVVEGLTRKSIVTHYCPINCDPVYSDDGRQFPRIQYNDIAYYTWARYD
jgi:phytanoyl-CoA hydroxylase